MSERWGRMARLARPTLGIAVLVLVLAGSDPVGIVAGVLGATPVLAIPAIIGLVAVHAVPALAWRLIVRRIGGLQLPVRSCLALFYAAQALGGVTPANLGGDVHRAAVLRQRGLGWSASVAPLIVQRATSYLALSVLAVAGLVVLAGRAELAPGLVAVGVAFAVAVGATAWLLLSPPAALRAAQRRLVRMVGGGEQEGISAPDAPDLRAGAGIGLASGLAFHAVGIGLTWLLVLAVDSSATSPIVPAALAIARLGLAVPLTPSGLGVQEGVLLGLLTAAGASPAAGIAGLLLARAGLLLTTLLGAALLVRGTPPDAQTRPTTRPASAPSAR